jgi:hypothetical protein
MRRRASLIAVACLFLLGAISPSAVSGGTFTGSFFGEETGTQVEFTLGKAPHTVLDLTTSGQRVTLEATRGNQSVSYEVPGAVSAHAVKADFGRAGKVDVRFKPSGPPRSVEPLLFCKGKDGSVATGAFVGTIRFTGFDRFVHFHTSRAAGTVSKTPPRRCQFPGGPQKHPQPEGGKEEEKDETVALSAAPPCGQFGFAAVTSKAAHTPLTLFLAVSREHIGRVRVSRLVLLFAERPGLFSFDPALTTASVAPPPPFHGSAEFRRGVGGAASTWTGSLSVSFLDGSQPLTGGRIEAELEASGPGEGESTGSKCELGHARTSALSVP